MKNIKTLELDQLMQERVKVLSNIKTARGVAKKDLNKYLARLNEQIGRKRKCL